MHGDSIPVSVFSYFYRTPSLQYLRWPAWTHWRETVKDTSASRPPRKPRPSSTTARPSPRNTAGRWICSPVRTGSSEIYRFLQRLITCITFRAFSRRFYPKLLTISTFVSNKYSHVYVLALMFFVISLGDHE